MNLQTVKVYCRNSFTPILNKGGRNYTYNNRCVVPRKKKYKNENYHKDYYQANKDKLKEYKRNYYLTNKDKLKEKHKNYYENNKELLKQKRLS